MTPTVPDRYNAFDDDGLLAALQHIAWGEYSKEDLAIATLTALCIEAGRRAPITLLQIAPGSDQLVLLAAYDDDGERVGRNPGDDQLHEILAAFPVDGLSQPHVELTDCIGLEVDRHFNDGHFIQCYLSIDEYSESSSYADGLALLHQAGYPEAPTAA